MQAPKSSSTVPPRHFHLYKSMQSPVHGFYTSVSRWRVSLILCTFSVCLWLAYLVPVAWDMGAIRLLRYMTTPAGLWITVVRHT